MPLPSNTLLSPHFTAGELRADAPDVPPGAIANLKRVADYLEVIRETLGNKPIRVTSGWRSDAYNEQVGGSPTSSHVDGLAADFVPTSGNMFSWYQTLSNAGLPTFDQLIFYPVQGHVHIGLGAGNRREIRIKLYEGSGGTPLLTAANIARLPGFPIGGASSVAPVVAANPTLAIVLAGAIVLAFAFA